MAPTLQGRRVALTGTPSSTRGLQGALTAAGAEVLVCPLVQVASVSPVLLLPFDQALSDRGYAGLLVTSPNGARVLVERVRALGLRRPWPPAFVTGAATARVLAALGIAALLPEAGHAEGVAALVLSHFDGVRGRRFLFPRSAQGRTELIERLEEQGAHVDAFSVYTTRSVDVAPELPSVDVVVLASPSAARAYAQWFVARPAEVVCLGPTTAQEARAAGLFVSKVAEAPTGEALVAALG